VGHRPRLDLPDDRRPHADPVRRQLAAHRHLPDPDQRRLDRRLQLPADVSPGVTAPESIPDGQSRDIAFPGDAAGTAFAPITLTRWDGVAVPMGPLNTPIGGFYDGQREWGVFIVGGGQACSAADAASGAACPSELSPQAADLRCGLIDGAPRCPDTALIAVKHTTHIAERVGPSAFVSRALSPASTSTSRCARCRLRFPATTTTCSGNGAQVLAGTSGFDDLAVTAVPYFAYHPLPFAWVTMADRASRRASSSASTAIPYGDRRPTRCRSTPASSGRWTRRRSWIAPLDAG
jgi:hypothetical protein